MLEDDLGGGGGGWVEFGNVDFWSFRLTPARLGTGGFFGLDSGDKRSGAFPKLPKLSWLMGKDNPGLLFEVGTDDVNIPMVTFSPTWCWDEVGVILRPDEETDEFGIPLADDFTRPADFVEMEVVMELGRCGLMVTDEDEGETEDETDVDMSDEDESGDRSSLFNDLGLISILVVFVEKLDFGELSSELGVSISLSSNIAINFDLD